MIKKILIVLAVLVILFPFIQESFSSAVASAATTPVAPQPIAGAVVVEGPKIILDGTLLVLNNGSIMANNRTLTPMRQVMEAMGATVGWDESLRRITLYLGDKYAILHVDTPQLMCGTYSSDNLGNVNFLTRLTYTMDAPVTILNDVSYVPIRAVAESLGAAVSWDAQARTVYINSPFPPAEETPDPGTAPSEPLSYNTMHFQEISGAQAQEWHDKNASFILYYYSSLDPSSNAVLEWVLAAAKEQDLKVYGVDKDSTKFDNTAGQLTFVWNYLDRASANTIPSLMFVVSPKTVTPLIQPKSKQAVEFCMTAFYYNAIYSPKTSAPNIAPQPSPGVSVDVAGYWMPITLEEAISKYQKNDKFIYICYNSLDPASNALMPMLRLAIYRTKTVVYTTDFAGVTVDKGWFGYEALNGKQLYAYPTLFFCFNNFQVPYASVQPGDIQEIMDAFANFNR